MNTTSGNRTDKNNERAGVGQTKKKFRKDNKPEGCEATSSRFNQEKMNQGILFSARKFSFQAFSNQLTKPNRSATMYLVCSYPVVLLARLAHADGQQRVSEDSTGSVDEGINGFEAAVAPHALVVILKQNLICQRQGLGAIEYRWPFDTRAKRTLLRSKKFG